MLLGQMVDEVRDVRPFGSKLTCHPRFAGFIRRKMGFTFLGETRHGEHWVIADVRIKNFDKSVSCLTNIRIRQVSDDIHASSSIGTCGVTSRILCETKILLPRTALKAVFAVRLIIRPTDDAINDEFWVVITGSDIDWQGLSTSPEHFIEGVKKLSGLDSLEVSEMMTLNYYRYV